MPPHVFPRQGTRIPDTHGSPLRNTLHSRSALPPECHSLTVSLVPFLPMTTVAAWYHCSVKPVSRSAGRSVIAAAAYRTGTRLEDRTTGEAWDFTRRRGVETWFAVAPADAPDWARDPETLWNAAEKKENRKNSQLAREYELALPASLSTAEREAIAHDFTQEIVDRYGVAATVAVHRPGKHGDLNHHAHILTTTRSVDANGWGKKTRVLDDRKSGPLEVAYLRGRACELINAALERAGLDERVDHRSFEARGVDRVPGEHLGPAASEMERDGRGSQKGDRNRDAATRNAEIDAIEQALEKLLAEQAALETEIVAREELRLDERYGLAKADEADDASAEWQEQKRQARDAIAGAEPFARHIRDDGQVNHQGVGNLSWWQCAVDFGREMLESARDWLRNTWTSYLEGRDSRADDHGHDDGPDLER